MIWLCRNFHTSILLQVPFLILMSDSQNLSFQHKLKVVLVDVKLFKIDFLLDGTSFRFDY